MTAQAKTRLRVAAINFLNPAPLLYNFEHEPAASELRQSYEVNYTSPALCAELLGTGQADLGLIPIGAMPYIPGLAVVPGCVIASSRQVRSIQLVLRPGLSMPEVRSIAADTASRSSIAYVRILLRAFHGVDPKVTSAPADLSAMLQTADAALLIGDPALVALERRDGPEGLLREASWFDVAELWHGHTGLPWVAAVWAVRTEALHQATVSAAQLVQDLNSSRIAGVAHVPELVAEWQDRIAVPPATIAHYLSRNIHYCLDAACLESIASFYLLGARTGVLLPYTLPLL